MNTVVRLVETPTTVLVGIQGPRGPQGIQGIPGEDAVQGDGDLNYHYVQGAPSDTWVIAHNLNKYPSVSVIDSGGTEVVGSIIFTSTNQLTISFSAAFAGDAYLN